MAHCSALVDQESGPLLQKRGGGEGLGMSVACGSCHKRTVECLFSVIFMKHAEKVRPLIGYSFRSSDDDPVFGPWPLQDPGTLRPRIAGLWPRDVGGGASSASG